MKEPTNGALPNPELKAMHESLIALVRTLEESIDAAPTAAAISAIVDRIADVNARVTSTGSVLLARQTDEIVRLSHTVAEALPRIEDEIADIERLESTLGTITDMLATVDEAVNVAKMVCR
ncbi:hypothetical protein [Sphingomonas sp. CFBP 13706]|uniref:hypothetical protein n=1 Tax=Sphingomonas sp. CFBP 13706 TaxID=2775314 RepID=UPI00177FFFBD|nr:hypothetical protein [Sphingomonas sp. CFBP 13706]MBD8736690.1 hypothetical protein [Sphingomonas sp. CFBP 13706]